MKTLYTFFLTIIISFEFITLKAQCVANAGQDTTICGLSFITNPLPDTTYQSVLWWCDSPGVIFANPNALYSSGVVPAPVNYIFTMTVVDVNGDTCSDDVNYSFHNQPTATFTTSDTFVNANEPITAAYTGNAGPVASYSWNFNGATVLSGSGPGPYVIAFSFMGTYTICLTVIENGCSSTVYCNYVSVLCAVYAGADRVACGLTANLSASSDPYDIAQEWTCSAPGVVIAQPENPNSAISVPAPGTYTFTWTVTNQHNNECSDSVNFVFISADYAGADTSVYGNQAQLHGPVGTSGYWSTNIANTIFDPNYHAPDAFVTIPPNFGLTGTFVWHISQGINCPLTDTVIINFYRHPVSGRVFYDINENGILDAGENGIPGHMIRLEPGPLYTYTDFAGKYHFDPDTGNVVVTYIPSPYWYTIGPGTYNVSIDSAYQCIDTLNFGIKSRVDMPDASIYITGSQTRVSFPTGYWLDYKNWGTVPLTGNVSFEYDTLLTYISSNQTPASHTGNTLVFAYDTLDLFEQRNIYLSFLVPGTQFLGDTLQSYAIVTPIITDSNTVNNYDTLYQVITGSYDPNNKVVFPAGEGQEGEVLHGQRLNYTIHFQNTGTDTAFTVEIRDTLDVELDIETLLIEAYSHPVYWELFNSSELRFTFYDIMLPDSNVNEPASNGYIRYSISPKTGLADGTQASNTAYIYFDYNPSIVTNTTINTFVSNIPFPVFEIKENTNGIFPFPNPANEKVQINLPESTRMVEVYNSNGKLIRIDNPQNNVLEIFVKEFPKGLYLVKIQTENGVITAKFVKE